MIVAQRFLAGTDNAESNQSPVGTTETESKPAISAVPTGLATSRSHLYPAVNYLLIQSIGAIRVPPLPLRQRSNVWPLQAARAPSPFFPPPPFRPAPPGGMAEGETNFILAEWL